MAALPNPIPEVELQSQMITVSWNPGAVNADTAFDLPAGTPPVVSILAARYMTLTEGAPNTMVTTALTVNAYAADMSSDEIALVDYNSVICGTAMTASMLVELLLVTAPKGYNGSITT